MDRRSWPWKKKSSDKATVDSANATTVSAQFPPIQENSKKPSYVQISVELYTHLSGLEDEVKSYKEQVQARVFEITDLTKKLSTALTDIVTKEGLVKQHARVAEEAISGWEKAETEASTLKTHLEAITLEKLTVEDRAAHLDSALRECMRGITNLKEDHERDFHDVIFSKTKQFEKLKLDLESKIANLDQKLRKSEAENAALARSFQERSSMLINISEQKSQAGAEIEHLRGTIDSCEREVGSLKYELHLAAKELEDRKEENSLSVRSADIANKKHADAVRKITKLEVECQRLRGLVRKKMLTPAALSLMKLEVGSLGRDYGDSRRRSSGRTSSPFPDFQLEEFHKLQKHNELLTEHLLAMEEDNTMLKEALAKRNTELQDSLDLCANIRVKPHQTEIKSIMQLTNAVGLTSMSEDGNEYAPSYAESWSTGLQSDLTQFKQGKAESANHLDFMDDFLEMEKLACFAAHSGDLLGDTDSNISSPMKRVEEKSSNNVNCLESDVDVHPLPLMKLQSRISMLYEHVSKESDSAKILEDMRSIVSNSLKQLTFCCGSKKIILSSHASCDGQLCAEDAGMTTVKELSPSQDTQSSLENMQTISQEIVAAIYQIHDFIVSLGKAAEAVHELSPAEDGLVDMVNDFSDKFSRTTDEKIPMVDFVADLSHILHRADGLRFTFLGSEENDVEKDGSDCIDKVALPEQKLVTEGATGKMHAKVRSGIGSNPEPGVEVKTASNMCPMEDLEIIKTEKENLQTDVSKCLKELENALTQLSETERKHFELKSQLDLSQKSNSIAEIQLKCMVESYMSLERRAEEKETELNLLREKTKKLEYEFQEEKTKHQEALDSIDDLQAQLQRNNNNSESSTLDADHRTSQEKELAAAAIRLADCQETIFLPGRQLKSSRPHQAPGVTPERDIFQRVSSLEARAEENITFEKRLELDRAKVEAAASVDLVYKTGSESPMTDVYNALYIPPDSEASSYLRSPINAKHQMHRSSNSLPPDYAAQTPENHSRGISKFFSTKGKS